MGTDAKNMMALAKIYAEMLTEKKTLEASLKRMNEAIAIMDAELVAAFTDAELQSVKLDSGTLLYMHRQVWAGAEGGDKLGLIEALKSNESTAWLVEPTVNAMKLSSFVREQPQDPGTLLPMLPPHLAGKVSVTERISIRKRG